MSLPILPLTQPTPLFLKRIANTLRSIRHILRARSKILLPSLKRRLRLLVHIIRRRVVESIGDLLRGGLGLRAYIVGGRAAEGIAYLLRSGFV